jgi:hypothetical protein
MEPTSTAQTLASSVMSTSKLLVESALSISQSYHHKIKINL